MTTPDENAACCAHLDVIHQRIHHVNGTCSDRWECTDCHVHFVPAVEQEAMEQARAILKTRITQPDPVGLIASLTKEVETLHRKHEKAEAQVKLLREALQDFDCWLLSPDLSPETLKTMRQRARTALTSTEPKQ